MGCDNCLGLPAAGQSGGVGQQPADLGAQEVWIRVIEMPGGGRRATGEIGCAMDTGLLNVNGSPTY
jgi:hypothetical protein